jgi:hypothetical protein
VSTVLAAWLVLSFGDDDSNYYTVWELGTAPVWIAILAVGSASAIGVHLRRSHARLGVIAALGTVACWHTFETTKVMLWIQSHRPAAMTSVWHQAAILVALTTLVAWYLYSNRTRMFFGG